MQITPVPPLVDGQVTDCFLGMTVVFRLFLEKCCLETAPAFIPGARNHCVLFVEALNGEEEFGIAAKRCCELVVLPDLVI
ncbi:hypothetical protein BOW13_11410 [Solemya velum gill symbiont]|nr:hypothetical protein BOV94_09430 [Solemya velum gill symbiont]OOY73430.1 hypothetical protein BOW08_02265 [Solemya velum gill symbiont]OOY83689.1 hypothetical protein BOW13_11410 [Solemya velum gill symbiont]OOZ00064.1 hypothetical protein BOW19_02745 [Solemya velum gill symbiont]